MTATHYQVIAHYFARPNQVRAVLALLAELARASRQEPANLSYEFFQNGEDPEHIVILERYVDAAGFERHRDSEHFQRIGAGQIIPLLTSRRVERYEGSAEE
ncbi:quinol monooxygenase YgiN [Arthrobacter silviterrae]|uniref:Antibiotic biosynthesis monooxygenase n=1 Tax=Arthrobacter silviterrae TaxID=2026658 RepID=A0ABX0DCM8_9MICC|nr:antibiotic biosynthesis monooxygenase [Arthrobacter silviterrae]MDQ0276495.1 quinol monooxygenase YgiN [Arthrobacter silviterrae]NGN84667.1 antibiotic biosynthesis monooxygenase [Arthrobacter silviterrae]